MSDVAAKGVSVTFTPVYNGAYLFVQRHPDDAVLGGYWCFPGGKVHVGETVAVALRRECLEETGLQPTGRAFFVDSYLLGDRLGLHFALEVTNNKVALQQDELAACAWVQSESDLGAYNPRIPGINNHLHYIQNRLALLKECDAGQSTAATKCLEALC